MNKIFEIITEIVGWLQIVLSPTLLGIVFGFGIYHYFPNQNGMVLGMVSAIIGLIIGIIWATVKYKTTGTIEFLSRISSTPDLDKMIENQNKKKNIINKKNSH
jgi:chromate transport protein ChrA